MPAPKSDYEKALGITLTNEQYAKLTAPPGGGAQARPADAYEGAKLGAGEKRGNMPAAPTVISKPLANGGTSYDWINAETGGGAVAKAPMVAKPKVAAKRDVPSVGATPVGMDRPPPAPPAPKVVTMTAPAGQMTYAPPKPKMPAYAEGMDDHFAVQQDGIPALNYAKIAGQQIKSAYEHKNVSVPSPVEVAADAGNAIADGSSDLWEAIIGDERKKWGL